MAEFPQLTTLGVDGVLVSFADRLSEPANRAAIAFRARVEDAGIEGVRETAPTLASVYVRIDPRQLSHDAAREQLSGLLDGIDWSDVALPEGRRLWHIPTVYGGEAGPQLEEAAEAAGLSPEAAIDELSSARLRILALGFSPGQPYLGRLGEHWDLPRQTKLTPTVPAGALVVAVRQFVLFGVSAPTGWRQVGLTGFGCFRPGEDPPIPLAPGDEAVFEAVSPEAFREMKATDPAGAGARVEALS